MTQIKTSKIWVTLSLLLVIHISQVSANDFHVKNELVISVLVVQGAEQRNAFERLALAFERKNPKIKVKLLFATDSNYKNNVPVWLEKSTNTSLIGWQGGERLFSLVQQGLIHPITELWNSNNLTANYPTTVINTIKFNNNIYGIPFARGFWGFFYNKGLFDELKISPPKTWSEFVAVCEKIQQNNKTPIGLANHELWPAAAWFDYLLYRTHGLDIRNRVVRGDISYDSPQVHEVMNLWSDLLSNNYFNKNPGSLSREELKPLLYRRYIGMTLSGSFMTSQIPSHLKDEIGFFAFPKISATQDSVENAPIDVFIIPKNAPNKEDAQRFLSFLSETKILKSTAKNFGFVSPGIENTVLSNSLLEAGRQTLLAADQTSQYFDREIPEQYSSEMLSLFNQFIMDKNIDAFVKDAVKVKQAYKESLKSLVNK